MKHCHISLLCNELPYLEQKLPFLYKFFNQIIFVDYDILNNCNSKDGGLEFIKEFPDPEKKIELLTDFSPNKITNYNGVSMIEKQKMFAYASQFIKDNNEVIWATDLDEFFDVDMIKKVEGCYKNDDKLISINIPHIGFVYNQYNTFNYPGLFYIKPRITKHIKGKIYGHCNFDTYGKTIKLKDDFLYHFSYVGYERCHHKLVLFNKKSKNNNEEKNTEWLKKYLEHLKGNQKYININHPGNNIIKSKKYEGSLPDYINIEEMVRKLNII